MLDSWILSTGRTRDEFYYTTYGDYVRHLLYAALKEAQLSSYFRLHATYMVNMVAKSPLEPEKLWKVFTDRPKLRQAAKELPEPDLTPETAAVLQELFLSGTKEVIRR